MKITRTKKEHCQRCKGYGFLIVGYGRNEGGNIPCPDCHGKATRKVK